MWNSIPVLVTTAEQRDEAMRWIEGSFHELRDVFRIMTVDDVFQYYRVKQRAIEFEKKLGLIKQT